MDATAPRPERAADRRSDAVKCGSSCCDALGPRKLPSVLGLPTSVASMSINPETTRKIAVEERTPAKPAPADTASANPLRKAALIVVAVTIRLFALWIVLEGF